MCSIGHLIQSEQDAGKSSQFLMGLSGMVTRIVLMKNGQAVNVSHTVVWPGLTVVKDIDNNNPSSMVYRSGVSVGYNIVVGLIRGSIMMGFVIVLAVVAWVIHKVEGFGHPKFTQCVRMFLKESDKINLPEGAGDRGEVRVE